MSAVTSVPPVSPSAGFLQGGGSPAGSVTTGTDSRVLAQTITRWLAVGVGFSIPVSTSLAEIMVGLFIVSCLVTDRPSVAWITRAGGRSVLLAVGLFAALAAGVCWSSAGVNAGLRCLFKYREFLYLPLMAHLFTERKWRQPAMWSFMAGCGVLLGLSYFEWLTHYDMGISMERFPNDHVVSKDRIVHSLLMSLFAYFCGLEFLRNTTRVRWLYAFLVCAAAFNTVFLVQGRTGYLTLSALLVLLLTNVFGKRGLLAAVVLLAVGATVAGVASPVVRTRFNLTWNQFRNQFGAQQKHSDDPRLEFYVNTLTLLRQHPFAGSGTGSFQREYDALIAGRDLLAVSEPHNEYLLLSVQLGLLGGLAYVALLGLQWLSAARMPDWERQVMQGTIVCIGLGSLFNSLILSVTGGLVWCYFTGLACGAWNEASASPDAPQPQAVEA